MTQVVILIASSLISLIFGALITYFFKNVFQKKLIDESIASAIHTHVLIYHQKPTVDIIKEELNSYTREVEYKLEQRDKQIANLTKNLTKVSEVIHSLELSLTSVLAELKETRQGS